MYYKQQLCNSINSEAQQIYVHQRYLFHACAIPDFVKQMISFWQARQDEEELS